MNLLLISICLLTLGAIVNSLLHAPTGYEASDGFHQGVQPRMESDQLRVAPDRTK